MGKKLYEETEEGGIYFKSERKPWEVRVPNYVYDLWMPVLGVVDIGVYSVYCRLERENIVKAITLKDIARACRIGKSRLYDINKRLEKCGFIQVAPPEGWQRLAHHTTEITVYDPPGEVPAWAIKEYVTDKIQGEYQPLSPWLVEDETQTEPPEVPNGTPEGTDGDADEGPDRTPNIETLDLKPLDVEALDVESDFPSRNQSAGSSKLPRQKADPLLFEKERATAAAQAEGRNYAAPPSAGGAFALGDRLITVACARLGRSEPEGQKRQSARAFFEKGLKSEGLLQGDIEVLEKAVKDWLDPEGEYAFFRPQYELSPKHELALRHFGIMLSRAKAKPSRAPPPSPSDDGDEILERIRAKGGVAVKDDKVGQAVKRDLQLQMTKATFQTYVQPAQFVQEDGTLHVTAPNAFVRDWLADRLARSIGRAAVGVLGRPVEVEFEVMP